MTRYSPLWLQDTAAGYSASLDRALIGALWPGGGAVGAAATAVANTMNVSIPAGSIAVPLSAGQGSALCRWDAAEVVTLATAPTANTRIDLVVCQVRDTALDAGANTDFIFNAVTGTAAATPSPPAVPANAFPVCTVTVGTNVANLNASTVTDLRPPFSGTVSRFVQLADITPVVGGTHSQWGGTPAVTIPNPPIGRPVDVCMMVTGNMVASSANSSFGVWQCSLSVAASQTPSWQLDPLQCRATSTGTSNFTPVSRLWVLRNQVLSAGAIIAAQCEVWNASGLGSPVAPTFQNGSMYVWTEPV